MCCGLGCVQVKKRRQERELERQQREDEMSLMQRCQEAAQLQEWERREHQFHLEQARLRSCIRIQDGRAKPIDLLAKYISTEGEVDAVEMHEPYTYLNGLTIKDLEDLIEDIRVYKELERGKNLDYWNDIVVIVEDELHKLEKQSACEAMVGRREGMHPSVAKEVASVFEGKTVAELEAMWQQIKTKISGRPQCVDIGYWESLLSQLKVHMARARLQGRHQDKLEMLKEQQGVAGDGAVVNAMLSESESGRHSPQYLSQSQLPGTVVMGEQEDLQSPLFARYRLRKPQYFNRVHTGFQWNNYNRTHYDMDNPPPKIVHGYEFNILYPDLMDKNSIPQFSVTPCRDNKDFSVLNFHAGPPYKDVAFKIVTREWARSYKAGYRCQFHNNIFQLWFRFKRYRYRR
jgi:hypothetical protein